MALRTTRPVPRKRYTRLGGGAGGSQFAGKAVINLRGLDAMEKAVAGPALGVLVSRQMQRVYERSQELVPVDTGQLKDSGNVSVDVDGASATGMVEYTANHAAPVEFGAQGREPRPYLRTAWDEIITFGDGKEELGEGLSDLLSKTGGGL